MNIAKNQRIGNLMKSWKNKEFSFQDCDILAKFYNN